MKPVKTIVALLIGACAYGAVQWFNNTLNVRYIATKCERRIEKTADPLALQAWATNLLDHYSISKTNYGGPFPPFPALANVWERDGPITFILGGDGQEESFVCISWGAAAGHWGVSVGQPSFVPLIPEHGSRMWKPGIYFWQQLH
jgi:hypothetical protein